MTRIIIILLILSTFVSHGQTGCDTGHDRIKDKVILLNRFGEIVGKESKRVSDVSGILFIKVGRRINSDIFLKGGIFLNANIDNGDVSVLSLDRSQIDGYRYYDAILLEDAILQETRATAGAIGITYCDGGSFYLVRIDNDDSYYRLILYSKESIDIPEHLESYTLSAISSLIQAGKTNYNDVFEAIKNNKLINPAGIRMTVYTDRVENEVVTFNEMVNMLNRNTPGWGKSKIGNRYTCDHEDLKGITVISENEIEVNRFISESTAMIFEMKPGPNTERWGLYGNFANTYYLQDSGSGVKLLDTQNKVYCTCRLE